MQLCNLNKSHTGSKRHKLSHDEWVHRQCQVTGDPLLADPANPANPSLAHPSLDPSLANPSLANPSLEFDCMQCSEVDEVLTAAPAIVPPMGDTGRPEEHALADQLPNIDMTGNEELAIAVEDINEANRSQLHEAFSKPETRSMKMFWSTEHASGPGKAGGGLLYLTKKIFQNAKDAQIDTNNFPTYEESRWHLRTAALHHHTTGKVREQQADLTKDIANHLPDGAFFTQTFVPPKNKCGKCHGPSGKNSMIANLPIPQPTVIGGVSYVCPKSIVSMMMAFGVPVECNVVRPMVRGKSQHEFTGTDKLSSLVSLLTRKDSRRVRPVDLLVEISCGDSIRL